MKSTAPANPSNPFANFGQAQDGNISIIFAVVLVPLVSFVGAAVDYSRAANARTAMQAAADSAALMVSKDLSAGIITTSQIDGKAQAYFRGLYTNVDAPSVTVSASYTKDGTGPSTITINGSGTMPTTFMRVAGFPSMGLSTSSTATWGRNRLRLALALDNTGSMADDGKIGALRTAAAKLVDQLTAGVSSPEDVYISLVPFAAAVKLGTNFKNSGYIDFSANPRLRDPDNWNGCVMDRGTNSPPGRTIGPDVTVAPPTSFPNYYPADATSYCPPQQIMPLTTDWASLKKSIEKMTPYGGTNQPIGLVWAWQTLQQSAPFNAPAEAPNIPYKKAIILLSDGLNTVNRWTSQYYADNDQAAIDARQTLLCDNVKLDGIAVYTIQVNTKNDPVSTILKYCATDGNFFATSTADGIQPAFDAIKASLSKLRLSK